MAQNPQYAVQRAQDDYTQAKFTASAKANLMGDDRPGDAEEDLTAIIAQELPDMIAFIDSEMGQKRAKATEYYKGDLFGNEEEGRSKVVSRDVLAVVQALMPSIMRTFFGGRRRMRFRPQGPQDVETAEQATVFVNQVVMQIDNNGFLEFYAAAKDALIRYKGVFKWWWDDGREVTTDTYTGLSEDALRKLSLDPEIHDLRVYTEETPTGQPPLYTAIGTRIVQHVGKVRFGCVPPEELLINRDARSFRDARIMDHRRLMTLGDLTALGYDLDDLLPYVGQNSQAWSPEVTARQPSGVAMLMNGQGQTSNQLMLPITYHEVYTYADMDGDGYAEPIKACGAGDGSTFNLLHWEPVSEMPFSAIDPDPEPHALFGMAPGPNVMDVQLIKSRLLRMNLDGLALALDPRLEVVENMVELDDLLNPEIGGIVRVRAPGQINPVRYDFDPAAAMQSLEYMDQVREERTRQSRPSQGLDADALQSSAKLAVAATLSGAQQQQEMICRLFAEGGVKDLFRGILRLLCRHNNAARMIQLRGQWVEVDPRTWNSEMDVEIEVAVGVGGIEMELSALLDRKATQEGILQRFGPGNPIVTVAQYRETLVKIDELRGLPDAEAAYRPVDANWAPPPSNVPSEAQVLQQTAAAELDLKRTVAASELTLKKMQILLEDQRERQKIANDFQAKLAMADAQAKQMVIDSNYQHAADLHAAQLEHQGETLETLLGALTDTHQINTQAETDRQVAAAQPAPGATNG